MNWPWSELGLPGPASLTEVRRAYAERLKATHPEEDPEGFQRLHEAYQQARRLVRKGEAGEHAVAPLHQSPQEQTEKPGKKTEEDADWDYDNLLRREESAREPENAESDWDYEGIFTELAEQRAKERQAHAEERRAVYFDRHHPSTPEERERLEKQWLNVEKAAAAVEELYASGAPLYVWINFLHSSTFFAVKGDEDFIVGLEEFLRRAPNLDESIKTELIKVFNLRQPYVANLWLGLQELLVEHTCSEAVKRAKLRRKKEREKVWAISHRIKARMQTWTKAQRIAWTVAVAFVALAFATAVFVGVYSSIGNRGNKTQVQERLCQYMEEDLGRVVESQWNGRANYENLYAPWDEPDLTFMAWPDGDRDLTAGEWGYTTNYSNVMVTKALQSFAKKWNFELELFQEGGCGGVMGAYGTSPGAYVLRLPLQGAEDGLTALGVLMAELEGEGWYQAFPPYYQLHFAYQNLTYLTYTAEGPFNAAAVLGYYENDAGAALCEFLVEQSGLAQEDFGGSGFHLEARGPIELDGKTWFLVSGMDESQGEMVRQYIFDGIYLTSLPAEEFSLDLKTYQLNGDRFNSTWKDIPRFLWISRR